MKNILSLTMAILTTLSAAASAQKIAIESFEVTHPDSRKFQIAIRASSEGVVIGSYHIRFFEKSASDEVPPGWLIARDGYATPEKFSLKGFGDSDNGEFDENPASNVYVRTFPIDGWKPGIYKFVYLREIEVYKAE